MKKKIIKECESCGFKTELELCGSGSPIQNSEAYLCQLCQDTLAGTAYFHPEVYPERKVLQMMAYTTHLILQKLEKIKPVKITYTTSDGKKHTEEIDERHLLLELK